MVICNKCGLEMKCIYGDFGTSRYACDRCDIIIWGELHD